MSEANTTGDVVAPSGKLLKADSVAAIYRADVEESIKAFTSGSNPTRKPTLVGILATDSKPSESYAEFTQKTCDAIGVEFVLKRVGGAVKVESDRAGEAGEPGIDGEGVELAIIEANQDPNIDGIMVCWTSRLRRRTAPSQCPLDRCTTQFLEGCRTIICNR